MQKVKLKEDFTYFLFYKYLEWNTANKNTRQKKRLLRKNNSNFYSKQSKWFVKGHQDRLLQVRYNLLHRRFMLNSDMQNPTSSHDKTLLVLIQTFFFKMRSDLIHQRYSSTSTPSGGTPTTVNATKVK